MKKRRRPKPAQVKIQVVIVEESTYMIFATTGFGRTVELQKEHCTAADGKYPKNFTLDTPTELAVPEWLAKKLHLPFTVLDK